MNGVGGPHERLGSRLYSPRYRLIAAWRSTSERNTPRCSRPRVRAAKKPSTALAQQQEVEVKPFPIARTQPHFNALSHSHKTRTSASPRESSLSTDSLAVRYEVGAGPQAATRGASPAPFVDPIFSPRPGELFDELRTLERRQLVGTSVFEGVKGGILTADQIDGPARDGLRIAQRGY
jgi:hypothetical protein